MFKRKIIIDRDQLKVFPRRESPQDNRATVRMFRLMKLFFCAVACLSGGHAAKHSRLDAVTRTNPFISKMVLEGPAALPPDLMHQFLYDQYSAKKITTNDVWDAIEYFKLTVLPELIGVDPRYQKIITQLDTELRHEDASEFAGEDHQEYITHETHKLYKKYNIKPFWPKSIKKRQAPKGFAKTPKSDL